MEVHSDWLHATTTEYFICIRYRAQMRTNRFNCIARTVLFLYSLFLLVFCFYFKVSLQPVTTLAIEFFTLSASHGPGCVWTDMSYNLVISRKCDVCTKGAFTHFIALTLLISLTVQNKTIDRQDRSKASVMASQWL